MDACQNDCPAGGGVARDTVTTPGFLIIAHAPLASALQTVARHAFPDAGLPLEALDVTPQMSPEEVAARAHELLRRVRSPQAMIFTDVFGATPSNVALGLADAQVKVVTGISVPMLWRTLCHAGSKPLDALVECAVAGGKNGAMAVASAPVQNQASDRLPNDQDHSQDQQ